MDRRTVRLRDRDVDRLVDLVVQERVVLVVRRWDERVEMLRLTATSDGRTGERVIVHVIHLRRCRCRRTRRTRREMLAATLLLRRGLLPASHTRRTADATHDAAGRVCSGGRRRGWGGVRRGWLTGDRRDGFIPLRAEFGASHLGWSHLRVEHEELLLQGLLQRGANLRRGVVHLPVIQQLAQQEEGELESDARGVLQDQPRRVGQLGDVTLEEHQHARRHVRIGFFGGGRSETRTITSVHPEVALDLCDIIRPLPVVPQLLNPAQRLVGLLRLGVGLPIHRDLVVDVLEREVQQAVPMQGLHDLVDEQRRTGGLGQQEGRQRERLEQRAAQSVGDERRDGVELERLQEKRGDPLGRV
jgi:hypothetical protein